MKNQLTLITAFITLMLCGCGDGDDQTPGTTVTGSGTLTYTTYSIPLNSAYFRTKSTSGAFAYEHEISLIDLKTNSFVTISVSDNNSANAVPTGEYALGGDEGRCAAAIYNKGGGLAISDLYELSVTSGTLTVSYSGDKYNVAVTGLNYLNTAISAQYTGKIPEWKE